MPIRESSIINVAQLGQRLGEVLACTMDRVWQAADALGSGWPEAVRSEVLFRLFQNKVAKPCEDLA
jgi:hypothetical protein